jgi:endonuclease-3
MPPRTTHPDLPFKLPRVSAAARARAQKLLRCLNSSYPNATCELQYRTPHELLVATILSAQATDVSVNKVTPALFARFPTPQAFAQATPEQIEPFIRSIGLFRSKARSIHAAMKDVVERFGGEVPRTMEDLLTLRGVARKTAGVVLGNAFGIQAGFVVDTHVHRLAVRLGLVPPGTSVAHTERRLMALFPRESWCRAGHQLIWHGRRACKARPPGGACADHPICREFGVRCEFRIKGRRAAPTRAVTTPSRTRNTQHARRDSNLQPSASEADALSN